MPLTAPLSTPSPRVYAFRRATLSFFVYVLMYADYAADFSRAIDAAARDAASVADAAAPRVAVSRAPAHALFRC